MKRQVLKGDIGKHGKIIAGEKGFKKTIYGTILHVDYFGAVMFIDHDDIGYRLPSNQVDSFEEEEFIPKKP
jgi:hypothetical protein